MYNQQIVDEILQKQQVALDSGNPPFAAVIVCDNKMIASVANDSRTTGNPLHHAEMLAIQTVIAKYGAEILRRSHLFSSNEPCPMCIGACIWSGIPNVSYFIPQAQITDIRGWGSFMSAQSIGLADDSGICISGPIGNHEMLQKHEIFWTTDGNAACKHSIHLST